MDDEADPLIRGIYSPGLRMVACVLIHAAFGFADRRVNRIFDARDWFINPQDDMIVVAGTIEDWKGLEATPRDERPGPEKFKRESHEQQPAPAHP